MDQTTELIRNKNVVAVIAFRETDIYATDAGPGERPARVAALDPRGRFHNVRHHAGNPAGTYEDDSPEYWKDITDKLAPAGAILVLGHGNGKANASCHWVTYVEKHRPAVAAKVVAEVRIDIDHIDERQVLRLAQLYFGEAPHGDLGDRRQDASWHAAGDPFRASPNSSSSPPRGARHGHA